MILLIKSGLFAGLYLFPDMNEEEIQNINH